jgi:alanyl-tRNA synthetase
MKSAEIRQAFIDFFVQKGHSQVASSSLVPMNDPSLLFTNAGMNQFKDVFIGKDKRDYTRACSTQRVVRAGGKHNDLDNVGYTARHHTFFEMLGNFSFGDYFKREAIQFAWEFLTVELKLPAEKLWVTVYKDDKQAEEIWLNEIGIDATRFSRLDEDNFWSMGDTGPCGPSTEIFYDHGAEVAGGPPGSPDEDGDRYIEIWNLVFMQFDRQADGAMNDLPAPSVDTGMGLERLAAVLQNVHSNYDIDLFKNLIAAVAKVCQCKDLNNNSLKVIADHIRSCSFLIADGVLPSNEGRGYVLRRIIRRAIRHGHNLGVKDVFFYQLVEALIQEMGEAYPILPENRAHVEKTLRIEEEQFLRTLDQGIRILESEIKSIKGDTLSGEIIFKLYDTYGFPADLTADIARERKLVLDMEGFDEAMQAQKNAARSASNFEYRSSDLKELTASSEFVGYEKLEASVIVSQLFKDGASTEQLALGEAGVLIATSTPFYGESGGQVGDQGSLSNKVAKLKVLACTKQDGVILHHVEVEEGKVSVSDSLQGSVNKQERARIAAHHSATHLMHAALKQVLGEHVSQKGSLVDSEKLRFDFSHYEALSAQELQQVEALVNQQILLNSDVITEETDIESAKQKGAMALFGEKYDARVRVLSMGNDNASANPHSMESFSMELCGGTHVKRTGDLGIFTIVSEGAVSSGVRRIEALSGQAAVEYLQKQSEQLSNIANLLKTDIKSTEQAVKVLLDKGRLQEKELEKLKSKLAASEGDTLLDNVQDIAGIKVLAAKIDADPKALREVLDQVKNKLGSGVIALAVDNQGKANLIAGVTKDLTDIYKAGELVNFLAQQLGGKGGGRPDMAQAGAATSEGLDKVLLSVAEWVKSKS